MRRLRLVMFRKHCPPRGGVAQALFGHGLANKGFQMFLLSHDERSSADGSWQPTLAKPTDLRSRPENYNPLEDMIPLA
jgi:hypothetical protein